MLLPNARVARQKGSELAETSFIFNNNSIGIPNKNKFFCVISEAIVFLQCCPGLSTTSLSILDKIKKNNYQ